ncbi:MAG: cobaltochelatase subunit CobN, partial [Rhabdaerophilum sp.]
RKLSDMDRLLEDDHELPAILHALDGGFTPPAQGGDVLRSPAVLPTGRNMHSFDPFRIPSAFAMADGRRQAAKLLARHASDGHAAPEKVAMVLWGADNVKTEGGPIAQAMALIGAEPRFDHYGRLTGAKLVPLAELGRPRIDVVLTLSGIFRDLLPLQTKLLAEACYLAASADEPEAMNFLRRNTLAYQREQACDFETAALRVFSNADGAYGSNVNHLIENGQWDSGDELAETYCRRKSFAYGRDGAPQAQTKLLTGMLSRVDLAYQNLESLEVGVTSLDQYFDTLGGISKAAQREKGTTIPVYIGDQTRSEGVVRTLGEQVSLEARTRILNPKWFEGMLKHGYEGVRQIEEHVRNTVGWSATTGQVEPWIYKQMTQTLMLDETLRERLIALNPVAASKVVKRLIEAHERQYWKPDAATAEALLQASEDLEDRIEGIGTEVAA